MPRYHIDTDSTVPVYRQLTDQINAEIRSGVLKNGEKLPTVREMADETRLSCGTVKRVYDRLQEMGVIEMTRRKGTYVKYTREQGDSRKLRAMTAIDRMLRQLSEMDFSLKEIEIFISLKLRELGLRQSGIRLTVLCDAPELERAFSRQLGALGNVTVQSCPLRQLREYPYSVDEQSDVILAAVGDCPLAESLLPDREKLIPVAMAASGAFLLQAAACAGQRMGILAQSDAFYHLVQGLLPASFALSRIDPKQDGALLMAAACGAVIVPEGYEASCTPELAAALEKKKDGLLVLHYGVDEGSMLYLNERLSHLREERRARPGGAAV